MARSKPATLPTVAPAPAPTEPSGTAAEEEAAPAASPAAAVITRALGDSKIAVWTAEDIGASEEQVEEHGGADLRHPARTYFHAAAARLQPAHHAGRRIQAEGAAAAEEHRVNAFHCVNGAEQIGLARTRRRAAHVHAGDGAAGAAEHDRAAGCRVRIGPVADREAGDIGECAWRDRSFRPRFADVRLQHPSRETTSALAGVGEPMLSHPLRADARGA